MWSKSCFLILSHVFWWSQIRQLCTDKVFVQFMWLSYLLQRCYHTRSGPHEDSSHEHGDFSRNQLSAHWSLWCFELFSAQHSVSEHIRKFVVLMNAKSMNNHMLLKVASSVEGNGDDSVCWTVGSICKLTSIQGDRESVNDEFESQCLQAFHDYWCQSHWSAECCRLFGDWNHTGQ